MQTGFFGEVIDVSNAQPQQEYTPLPAGWYPALCTKIDVQRKDWGMGANIKFKITEGEYANRTVRDFMVLQHKTSPEAHDFAQRKLRAWTDALGIPPALTSADPLLHKVVMINVSVSQPRNVNGKEYGPGNRIDTFAAYNGMPVTAQPQPAQVQRPAAPAAPVVQQAAPARAPSAAPAGNGARLMPWQRTS